MSTNSKYANSRENDQDLWGSSGSDSGEDYADAKDRSSDDEFVDAHSHGDDDTMDDESGRRAQAQPRVFMPHGAATPPYAAADCYNESETRAQRYAPGTGKRRREEDRDGNAESPAPKKPRGRRIAAPQTHGTRAVAPPERSARATTPVPVVARLVAQAAPVARPPLSHAVFYEHAFRGSLSPLYVKRVQTTIGYPPSQNPRPE